MKLENKREAQARKAAERARKEKADARKRYLSFWAPIVLVAICVVVLIWAIASSGSASSDTQTTEAAETDTVEISTEDTADEDSYDAETDTYDQETDTDTDTADTAETETVLDTTEGLVAEEGDTVNIDYTGYLDGEAFDGGSTNGAGTDLTLGSGSYIDGFEDQVVGHSVGETFDINVTFPEDYGAENLAGQDATFTITLNGIYKAQ